MFTEFTNQVYTESDESYVTISDNTDFSIDGSAKKFVFGLGSVDQYIDISFDEVDISDYEEICFHVSVRPQLTDENIFKITINGVDYNFTSRDFCHGLYNFIMIDCESMTSISSIRITNLQNSLQMFFDYPGVRKVTYADMDKDVVSALQDHISIDYGVSTTLSGGVSAGAKKVSLASWNYINECTVLQITDGVNTEECVLKNEDGDLRDSLTYGYASGSTVTALCKVLREDYDNIEVDPICGIVVTDLGTSREDVSVPVAGGYKHKRFLGALGVLVYIDCRSKQKVLRMAREYQADYGDRFQFLLDGELVDMYLEDTVFTDNEIGNNPRMAFLYRMEPQPITIATSVATTMTLTVEPEEIE